MWPLKCEFVYKIFWHDFVYDIKASPSYHSKMLSTTQKQQKNKQFKSLEVASRLVFEEALTAVNMRKCTATQ